MQASARATAAVTKLAESGLKEREAAVARAEAELEQRAKALAQGEKDLSAARAKVEARERAVAASEASLQQRQAQLADAAAAATAPFRAAPALPAAETDAAARGAEAQPSDGAKVQDLTAKRAAPPPAFKVRFDEVTKPAECYASAAAIAAGSKLPPHPTAKLAEPRSLQCDGTADWARTDNLTASLMGQLANPDEVFYPLPYQRTCELTDIFSAPRRRERAKGSGDWTPSSDLAPNFDAKAAEEDVTVAPWLLLIGTEGEYAGETVSLPIKLGAAGATQIVTVGRSSSCEVTLSRDDQISRRHLQIEYASGGKVLLRDLGSTYGTRLNGKALTPTAVAAKAGDVISLGTSSFQVRDSASS